MTFKLIHHLSQFVNDVVLNGVDHWKCLQEQGRDGSPRYYPSISLSVLLLLSLIPKFMTTLRGHQQGYTFGIPNNEAEEGMREGVREGKRKGVKSR